MDKNIMIFGIWILFIDINVLLSLIYWGSLIDVDYCDCVCLVFDS